MDAVDWTVLSVLAAVVLGAVGYLSRQMNARFDQVDARIDRLEGRMGARIDRLEERYVRHLEAHATGSAP